MRKYFAVFVSVVAIGIILCSFAYARLVHAQLNAKMRVMVYNDTERKVLPSKSEIWIRGIGSWWLQKATKFGGDVKEAPIKKVGDVDSLFIYPDGRGSGKEIKVPYTLKADMCMNACVVDGLTISISDSEVTVFGKPFKAATGQLEKKFKR
jgi:hypothetical protein